MYSKPNQIAFVAAVDETQEMKAVPSAIGVSSTGRPRLPEMPLVRRENICGQQCIGCGMRNHRFPDATPSKHRQTAENPSAAAGNPVSAVQKAEND